MTSQHKTHVLFVCLGNICRSPTAEGIFTSQVRTAQLEQRIYTDSAGTANYHTGGPPDDRATAAAAHRGYDLSSLRARQVEEADFDIFDYILAMDNSNLADLESIAPKHWQGQLSLMLDFDPTQPQGSEVPDPYFGGASGFSQVIDMLERSCQGLLEQIIRSHQSPSKTD